MLFGMISTDDLEGEARAQIERCLAAGLDPTHLDSHHHLHLLPGIWARMLTLAREYRIPVIRCPDEPLKGIKSLISILGRRYGRGLPARGVRTLDHYQGIGCAGSLTSGALRTMLQSLPEGVTEISCHPGLENDGRSGSLHGTGPRRRDELAVLINPKTRAEVERFGIRLTSYLRLRAL